MAMKVICQQGMPPATRVMVWGRGIRAGAARCSARIRMRVTGECGGGAECQQDPC